MDRKSIDKLRAEQNRLADLERELNSLQMHAGHAVKSAREALGATLVREHIGAAAAGEVEQAREALSAAETKLSDLELIAPALPRIREHHAEALRTITDQQKAERQQRHRAAFEAKAKEFRENFRDIAKSEKVLRKWTDDIYEHARRAGRAGEARELFREFTGRVHARDPILERFLEGVT